MTTRDLKSGIDVVQSIVPLVHSGDATGVGADLRGYESAVAEISSGADGGGTHAPRLEESDSLGSGYTTVDPGDLDGAFSVDLGADTIERVGYKGSKRFIRVFVATSGALLAYSATIIRGHAGQTPLA